MEGIKISKTIKATPETALALISIYIKMGCNINYN